MLWFLGQERDEKVCNHVVWVIINTKFFFYGEGSMENTKHWKLKKQQNMHFINDGRGDQCYVWDEAQNP